MQAHASAVHGACDGASQETGPIARCPSCLPTIGDTELPCIPVRLVIIAYVIIARVARNHAQATVLEVAVGPPGSVSGVKHSRNLALIVGLACIEACSLEGFNIGVGVVRREGPLSTPPNVAVPVVPGMKFRLQKCDTRVGFRSTARPRPRTTPWRTLHLPLKHTGVSSGHRHVRPGLHGSQIWPEDSVHWASSHCPVAASHTLPGGHTQFVLAPEHLGRPRGKRNATSVQYMSWHVLSRQSMPAGQTQLDVAQFWPAAHKPCVVEKVGSAHGTRGPWTRMARGTHPARATTAHGLVS